MNKSSCVVRVSAVVIVGGIFSAATSLAVPNNWTNSASSLWRTTGNWSLAVAPSGASGVDPTQITNAGMKTVTIDSATAAANLSVRFLTLSAPLGSTNTLALVNVPLGTPFTTSKALLVSNRAALAITNSAVNATADFDVAGGSLILNSGSLTCGLNCDLQSGSMTVNGGTLTATAGTTGIRMGRFSGANANFTLNGGTVNTLRVTLGSVSGSQSSLTLAGGTLICPESFSAAQLPSTTGNVTMTAGNLVVTNGTTKIADRATATFNQSGGNTFFADLSIGDLGLGTYNLTGGTFTATPRTNTDLCIIGNLENGDFNQSGGVALIRSEIHVADFAGVFGNINITGGQFFATNDTVAIGREGIGAMVVTNATVVLTNTSVGRHLGASGTLTVRNNGNISFGGDLSIGRLAGASGTVIVQGGNLSVTNDDLWIGRGGTGDLNQSGGNLFAGRVHVGDSDDGTNAPTGSLTIAGGNFVASSNLVVGTPLLSSGQLNISGGQTIVTNPTGTAFVQINSGSVTMDGGTLTTDKLLINNPAATVTFNNGVIRAKTITVSNGLPFTVGDGINPATLELLGGIYTFANGLVISSNATVTGCGTVIGTVVNNGTYNTCGSSPAIFISSITKTGNTTTLLFNTLSGSNHIVEFKTNLFTPTWNSLLPAVLGNGNTQSKTDTTATNASRFYRVRVQ